MKMPFFEVNENWATNYIANIIWDGSYSVSLITFEKMYTDEECPLIDRDSILFSLHD